VISARDAGHATIDGVDTTHYVVSLDPAKISQATNGVFGQVLPGFSPQVTVSTLTFDVWTDAQRRVRRYQSGETLTVSIAGHTVSAQVAATGDYTDFGVPVNVVAPPASQVTAVPNLSTLIPGFGGKGSVSIQPTV
jgi:hypothetical protein